MQQDEFETPWGTVTLESVMQLRHDDRQSAGPIGMPTGAGRASVTFYVDPSENAVPAHLRMVALGGYVNSFTPGDSPDAKGSSTLTVDGATLGWRAQAYIDPITGGFTEGRAIEVMLVDATGKVIRSLSQSDQSVRESLTEAVNAAAETDPGLYARLYATLLSRHVADLDEGVKSATSALEAATTLRDRAAALVSAATEAAEGHQAPSPGR